MGRGLMGGNGIVYSAFIVYLTLNFGQLLHLLDNERKNIIRNLKQKNIYISAQYGILYIYIYYIFTLF